jgi:hypothetical protein
MDRTRQWRRLASEWSALAQRTSEPKARASLLVVSQRCRDLAELSERDAWDQSRHAIQAGIGEGLRDFYSLPGDEPHRLVSLLVQMNAGNAKQDGARRELRRTSRTVAADCGVVEMLAHFLLGHASAGISERYVARMILSSGTAMREAQRKISRRMMALLKF